jgi:hypothetical protein
LQQLVPQQEKVLGTEHVDTLESKHQLAITHRSQQKYAEAEQLLRQSAQQQEQVLGGYHKDTLMSKELLQKVVLAKVASAQTNALTEIVSGRLSDFFADGNQKQLADLSTIN